MRTIDADELKKKLEAEHCDCEVIQIIDDMPTAAEAANAKAAAIIRHYGADHQKDILIEECALLIAATEKSRALEDSPDVTADMVEAMAAAYNAINAICCHMSRYWRGEFMKAMRYERRKRYDDGDETAFL